MTDRIRADRPTVVCATANHDKVVEIRAILGDLVDLSPRPADVPDVVEDADTLAGNARLKAAAISRATGSPAMADDTGLFVDSLDGAPGVFSARYAGEGASDADNRSKLLAEMDGIDDRDAHFRTVAIVVWPGGDEVVVEGVCRGRIALTPRGTGGFGYDPLFIPDEADGRSFAELTTDEKNAISHRGRAFRELVRALTRR